MRPSATAGFLALIPRFEGKCAWMYLDEIGLVTTGWGNLIDPISMVLGIPFERPDGTPASHAEIEAEWNAVKAMRDKAKNGGGWFKHVTTLRLSEAAIEDLVEGKLAAVNKELVRHYPAFESWPADAQLGAVSRAWAAGVWTPAPRFNAYALVANFRGCAQECGVHTPRDAVDAVLFHNAANVVAGGLDPDVLHWPSVVMDPIVVVGD